MTSEPSTTHGSRVDRWIFESHRTSAESLALYRILYGLFLLVFAMPSAVWVTSLPDVVYDPPLGPMRLLDGYPPASYFHVLTFLLSVSAVALTLGFRTRASSLCAGILLIALIGFEFCLGKIDHNRHMLVAVPLVLAWSGWGARYSLESRRQDAVHFWPMTLLALVLGLFFLASAIPKLAGGWLRLNRHGVELYVNLLNPTLSGALEPIAGSPIWKLADLAAVGLELGFVFAVLFGIRWTRIFCAVAVLFHAMNVVAMGIGFEEQLIVYCAFVEWQRVPVVRALGPALERAAAPLRQAPGLAVGLLGAVYFAFHTVLGSPLLTSRPHPTTSRLLFYAIPVVVAVVYLGRRLREAVFRRMPRAG